MKNKKFKVIILNSILILTLLWGCSGGREQPHAGAGSTENPGTERASQEDVRQPETETEIKAETETETETKEESFVSKFEVYPDDYFLTWAVIGDGSWGAIGEKTLKEINLKLEEDGYGFGVKFVFVDEKDYAAGLKAAGADIVSTGVDVRQAGTYREDRAKIMLDEGLLACLDERLAGSRLYDAFPELDWERLRYHGSIYYIPNDYMNSINNSRWHLWSRQERLPEGFPKDFGGDVLALEDDLSEDVQMYFSMPYFSFVDMLGYSYDKSHALVFREDGACVNPLEEERIVEWLRTMNRWYHEKKIQPAYQKMDQCAFVLSDSNEAEFQKNGWTECASWKGFVRCNFTQQTGILAASERKEEAFALLELFQTDHSYGNLLIYGKSGLSQQPIAYPTMQSWIYGLATGLKWRDLDSFGIHFASPEDKKQYYDDYMLPSPALGVDFPEECYDVMRIVENYLGDTNALLITSDFDTTLQNFRDRLKGPMDEVLKKLAEQ